MDRRRKGSRLVGYLKKKKKTKTDRSLRVSANARNGNGNGKGVGGMVVLKYGRPTRVPEEEVQ